MRARLAAQDLCVTSLLPGTVYATRTPCHDRLVHITERELDQNDRSITLTCPGCSAIWIATLYAPVVHWTH